MDRQQEGEVAVGTEASWTETVESRPRPAAVEVAAAS